jgi:hypothetical protein
MDLPTGDAAIGDIDGYMQSERSHYRDRADALSRQLGERFLYGSRERQATIVRDWVRNYREQGRLPRTRIPMWS